jgi:hypothetical protein
MNKPGLIALFAAVALLAGCGGGGADAPPAPPPAATDAVPGSASASTQGLKSYLMALSGLLPEDAEPLDLSSFAPQTSDDAEPEAVD